MAKIDEKWERIFKKIQLILDKNQKLSEQNSALELRILQLENKIIQYIKAAKEVHLSEKERAETKQQLKEFMEEIDDCLAKLIQ